MSQRIAILGGTGMAGHVMVAYLEEQGFDVFYTARSASNSRSSKSINAEDIQTLMSWLDCVKPDVVVNCLGILQKESEARPDKSILLNSFLPRYVEQKYRYTNIKFIHLSTDCVFSGKRGKYLEVDTPDGETIYDRTKALGEVVNNKDLTFRMSIIGPDCNERGTGLFNWFMKQQGIVYGFSKAIWNGVTTIELSRAVVEAIRQDLSGLYHLVASEPVDKHNLLLLFKEIFEREDIEIKPEDSFVVDKTLVNTRIDFNFMVQTYPQQINNMKMWVDKHAERYKHYFSRVTSERIM